MTFRVCFLGSFGGMACAHAKYQTLLVQSNPICRPFFAKRRRTVICCTQEQEYQENYPTDRDGELEHHSNVSMQDNTSDAKTLDESDRHVMDEITETGVKEIEHIAKEVKDDLEDLQRTVEGNVAKLIEEETQEVLKKYDQKQEELLGVVKKDRETISKEMEQIKKLFEDVESKREMEKTKTIRDMAYFFTCAVFTVSALYYAWEGVTDVDSAALRNSAINAVVAAACTLAFSLEKRK